MLNVFLHSKINFKQQEIIISYKFISPNSNKKTLYRTVRQRPFKMLCHLLQFVSLETDSTLSAYCVIGLVIKHLVVDSHEPLSL
jgi:hypothetical protein